MVAGCPGAEDVVSEGRYERGGALARSFPAFGPRRGTRQRFAYSWWGTAWITALEDTSLDRGRLSRGRTYARAGHVGAITVSPGRIAAPVYGSQDTPYRTVVYVEELTDAAWDRFLDQVAARAGHVAALLDADMPHDLVAAAADAGVPLLPRIGDLYPECDCLDWGDPCKHAAALCYQVATLLDDDPFVLLLLRGRGGQEVRDELQRRNAGLAEAPTEPVTPAGVSAVAVYRQSVPPLPDPPPLPAAREAPAIPLPAIAPAAGVDPEALRFLVANAAAQARGLLAGGPPAPDLDEWQDTVRIAATDERMVARLKQTCARPADLPRAVQAWRYGGRAGLDVLERPWTPPKADLARARAALTAAWEGDDVPALEAWRNRWTAPSRGLQLRYGQDGRWYPYRQQPDGDWWPAGPPSRDPAATLVNLR